MTEAKNDGGPAFGQFSASPVRGGVMIYKSNGGMSLRDWFAGQALSNPAITTGEASNWQLSVWFGEYRTGIARSEIIAKQAMCYADAMLEERRK